MTDEVRYKLAVIIFIVILCFVLLANSSHPVKVAQPYVWTLVSKGKAGLTLSVFDRFLSFRGTHQLLGQF